MNQNLFISVVAPAYNEQDNITIFYQTLKSTPDPLTHNWELTCVDDGNTDNTLAILTKLYAGDSRVKVIEFSRNFGKEVALSAGLDYASGEVIIPIDIDLQDHQS